MKDLESIKARNFKGDAKDCNPRLAVIRRLTDGNRLLEFASSWGYFLFQSRAYGFQATGVETASKRAEFGRIELGVDILPVLDSIEEKFDLICSFHTLEHLIDLSTVFDMFYERLLPGGIPGFIREAAHAVSTSHSMDLSRINNWMSTPGWNFIELGDHTFQVLIASLDNAYSGGRALPTVRFSPID